MLTRIKKCVSPFRPDKNHIHHLLLRINLKHRQVTFVLLCVSIVFIGLGLIARNWSIGILVLTAFVAGSLLTYILWRAVDKKTFEKK
jgi:UDP-GlcNAc:undecaprenyl-phosphate GlcNAc-1-phosphate transferase